jgi:arylsulfatase A-like enzyme
MPRSNSGRVIAAAGCILSVLSTAASPAHPVPPPEPPRLAVMIAVDQLRADLLERYDSLFRGGFRRLRDRGLRFGNAVVDHALTNSLPGHVTLATGDFPSHHGIVNSTWAERVDGKLAGVFGVEDAGSPVVGFPSLPGASPKRILVDGLADWILQADPAAEVVAVGTGEYSSLLHAGHTRRITYWFSPDAGRYVTTAWYRASDPEWVVRFQAREMPRLFRQRTWTDSLPAGAKSQAPRDAEPSEFDSVHTTFPHQFAQERSREFPEERRAQADWLYFTPMPDATTLEFAKAAIREMRLGQRGHTDYLAIVVSAVDHVGHRFGPLSREQLDNLLRLDRELGDFLATLDQEVGKDRYVVALSADHGSRDIPEAGRETGVPGRRVRGDQLDAMMKAVLDGTAGPQATPEEAGRKAAEIARGFDFVGGAVTAEDLERSPLSDPLLELMSHSFRRDRIPLTLGSQRGSLARFGVAAWLAEGVVDDDAPSNHGTPYLYDRRVPLIFMGRGIAPGASSEPARTVDVAPTLAALARIPVQTPTDGRCLLPSNQRNR